MARKGSYSSPAAALFSGLSGGFSSGMGTGMETAISAKRSKDALMNQLMMMREQEESREARAESKDIRMEKIRNVLAATGTPEEHDEAIRFLMMPEGTQSSLRADVGNVGVNEVDPRMKRTLQWLATAQTPKRGAGGNDDPDFNTTVGRVMANMGKIDQLGRIIPFKESEIPVLVALIEQSRPNSGPLSAEQKDIISDMVMTRGTPTPKKVERKSFWGN